VMDPSIANAQGTSLRCVGSITPRKRAAPDRCKNELLAHANPGSMQSGMHFVRSHTLLSAAGWER
jgi:hypothetical protein